MAKERRQRYKLTEQQELFCDLVAQGKSPLDAVMQAGYSVKSAPQFASQCMAKNHLRKRINWLREHKYGKEPEKPSEILDDVALEALLCDKAKQGDTTAMVKLAELRHKRQTAGEQMDVVPILLSPFLDEDILDWFSGETPEGVDIAYSPEVPENIDEKEWDE